MSAPVLIVAGMPGAGKEEFLSVAASMGVPFVRMGDLVRERHAASGSELSLGEFAGREREAHGQGVWAERSVEKIGPGVFLVDGCRGMSEVRAFRGAGRDAAIIGIHAPPAARYARLLERGRADAPRDMADFEERDARELSWGLGEVLALADVMISNGGSLESFRSEARKVLREEIG
ncbi:MAG: AAA family ATPase [Candidatus Methanoplasma sp.]|jgi:dephospho-CoA kinase|nr:AAA family ATPase [Candidatus Methanoplasma sp.]